MIPSFETNEAVGAGAETEHAVTYDVPGQRVSDRAVLLRPNPPFPGDEAD